MEYKYSVPLSESQNITVKSEYISDKLLPSKIKTNRLILKPIWNYDNHNLYRLYNSQTNESTKYVPEINIDSLNDVVNYKNNKRNNYNKNKSCQYVIEQKKDNIMIGFCGLSVDWDKKSGTYYIWLKPNYWGYEYAKERGVAFTSILFEVLDLESITVSALVKNKNSCKSIWKYVKEFGGFPTGLKINSYEITNSENRDNAIEFTITDSMFYSSLYNTSCKYDGASKMKNIISNFES